MQDRRHPLLPQTAITGFRKQGRRQERGPKQALEVHRHLNGWMWVEFITIRWSLVVSLWDCGTARLRPRLNTQKVSSRVASRLVLAIHSYCWRKVLVEGYTSEKWHFGREGPAIFLMWRRGKATGWRCRWCRLRFWFASRVTEVARISIGYRNCTAAVRTDLGCEAASPAMTTEAESTIYCYHRSVSDKWAETRHVETVI